jgi:hypothetical protein
MWVWQFTARHKTAKDGNCFWCLQRFSAPDTVWQRRFSPHAVHGAMLKPPQCVCASMYRPLFTHEKTDESSATDPQRCPNHAAGASLQIGASQNGDKIAVSISDTGQGIPEEIKPKLFKPLVTTKSKDQGFGLAVVKKLASDLGADISFDSRQGKGTTFKIELQKRSRRFF